MERFSEDMDLFAQFTAEASLSARLKILKAVDEAVRSQLSLVTDQATVDSSTTCVKRYPTYAYRPQAKPPR